MTHAWGKWNVTVQYIVNKQIWNVYILRIGCWSLKSLAMLKCESRTSQHAVQYSDTQTLFWCFVLIILRKASVDNLFLCSVGQQAWLCFYLFLKFFYQNQGFCSYKIVLIRKECNYVSNSTQCLNKINVSTILEDNEEAFIYRDIPFKNLKRCIKADGPPRL